MLQFELEVMLVGVRPEADLLDDHLGSVLFHLLGLLPLLVQILLVIEYLAHRRICLGADLHQVKFHFIGHLESLGYRIDAWLGDIVADKTNLRSDDLFVDVQLIVSLLADE